MTLTASAIVVIATRGSWSSLARLPIRGSPLFVASLLLQSALDRIPWVSNPTEHWGYTLLMCSYVLLLTFCLVNICLRGMGLIALGIALNAIVIGLNMGMPTRPIGIDNGGNRTTEPIERSVKHRPSSEDDLLGFLGDKILLPQPIDALISAGDVVLSIGICELAYFGSHRRRHRFHQRPTMAPRRARTRSSAPSTRPSYTYPGPV
jgi:hypothetical protein